MIATTWFWKLSINYKKITFSNLVKSINSYNEVRLSSQIWI